MKSLKIALFTIFATLFSLPAAASSFEQNIEFEINSSGILEGMRAPTLWNVDDAQEFDLFRGELIRWDVELFNAVHLCDSMPENCLVRITARQADGMILASQTYEIALDGSSALFTVSIADTDIDNATNFVGILKFTPAVQLEIQPELALLKPDDMQQAILQVDARYNFALIASDRAVVPFFDLSGI